MSTTTRQRGLLLLILLSSVSIEAQQLVYARDQRSLYGPPALGWNSIGGFSPLGLGHMTKDELLTLLEAWQEVEGDARPPVEEPAPRPPKPPAPPPRPPPPPPPPPPRPPAPPPAPPAPQPPRPAPEPGAPVNVRLPAFVPIQLSAMFTPSQAAAVGAGAGAGALDAGDGDTVDQDMVVQSVEAASPRIFRFMRLPAAAVQPRARAAQQPQVQRNTLESVDAGLAPLASLLQAKSRTNPSLVAHQKSPVRPRFVLPPLPHMANAPGPLELVPSSQIIGDWRE
ncbi:formin-like protein 14 [Drosophila grimshawi]|uniref:GH24906 n=1 Tax=Drosophila grimshawi TaxID=7222 RepID=B4JNX2_DROGR|nr:formin-like protein 14 [Drosophila grimshawi]EDV92415.1 GH24906 [Drosophila grimshawi]